jgi:hypothetical protein
MKEEEMFQKILVLVPAVLLLLAVSSVSAAPCGCGSPCATGCGGCGGCGEVQMVEKTICVPEWVTETRKCMVT